MIIPNVKFQPRFKAFMNYHGLSVGDSYKGHEFIIFIQSHLRNFLHSKNVSHLYNNQLHDEFTEYLLVLKPEK